MGAHRTVSPSRLPVIGARALGAATALTLLGGGAGMAFAHESHDDGHTYNIENSPSSESYSQASAVNSPDTDLSQDQDNEQDQDQDQDQDQQQAQGPQLLPLD